MIEHILVVVVVVAVEHILLYVSFAQTSQLVHVDQLQQTTSIADSIVSPNSKLVNSQKSNTTY